MSDASDQAAAQRSYPRPRFYASKRRIRRAVATPVFMSLGALALIYGSDKRTGHRYLPLYRKHLKGRRSAVRRMLEVGVGGYEDPYAGFNSLRMWRTFFPRARVFGLDIRNKVVNEPRITFVQGSQSDTAVLDRILQLAGGPLDLVIDDGSHVNEDVCTTFEYLFPHVGPGGLYVIEDLQAAYSAASGGGPPGRKGTSVAMAKDLVDGINRQYIPANLFTPTGTQSMVAAAHFYPNIVFIEKS